METGNGKYKYWNSKLYAIMGTIFDETYIWNLKGTNGWNKNDPWLYLYGWTCSFIARAHYKAIIYCLYLHVWCRVVFTSGLLLWVLHGWWPFGGVQIVRIGRRCMGRTDRRSSVTTVMDWSWLEQRIIGMRLDWNMKLNHKQTIIKQLENSLKFVNILNEHASVLLSWMYIWSDNSHTVYL